MPAQSSASDLQRSSRRTGADLRRSTSRSSTRCWMAPAHSMKGVFTWSASDSSSRGRSARPRTPSDLEATEIGHPHVATATTSATTNVAAKTTRAATTGDVTTTRRGSSRGAQPTSPAGDRQPQRFVPARQEVNQHDRQRTEEQHEQEEVPEGQP
jgi:hypothetical protein